MERYVIGIDQSTQGTKALLFNKEGDLIGRADLPHKQFINEQGWVEHDPAEIYNNTIAVVKSVIEQNGIDQSQVAGIGISNQRETAMIWNKETQNPVYPAIVWQCARGESICNEIAAKGHSDFIVNTTGLKLSPYFSAAKLSWIVKNVDGVREQMKQGILYAGTMDSWLVFKLTNGKQFKTDYSNASRTQLFDITKLQWSDEICEMFEINISSLASVCDSDSYFGDTDLEGYFDHQVPIHGVLGDSHGALFGQGCFSKGMIKATYGTGSSIMMNIGEKPVFSPNGIVTSLAWGMNGEINYVLEGNINYTGAVISWLKNDLKLISSPKETEELARNANKIDQTYLVPAFTGLGAPYWDSKATASFSGMSRTTKKEEMVKAALDSIAYQIADILEIMSQDSGIKIEELRVDGGPTKNNYLMQFQSDIAKIPVKVPEAEELSGIGAAYAAGIALGIFDKDQVFHRMQRKCFTPVMAVEECMKKREGWKKAVSHVLSTN